jgi:hypothetical protein
MKPRQPDLISKSFTTLELNHSFSLIVPVSNLIQLLDGLIISYSVHSQQFLGVCITKSSIPTENIPVLLNLLPNDPTLPLHLYFDFQNLDPKWPRNQFDPQVGF